MYHQPSESQLVRIIKFVSVADKNWNHKILFIIWSCWEVYKIFSLEGWDTLSTLHSLSILKQSESFLLIHFNTRPQFFFSHLETWSLIHKLWSVVLCCLYSMLYERFFYFVTLINTRLRKYTFIGSLEPLKSLFLFRIEGKQWPITDLKGTEISEQISS